MIKTIQITFEIPDGYEFYQLGFPRAGDPYLTLVNGSLRFATDNMDIPALILSRLVPPKTVLVGASDLMTDEREALIRISGRIEFLIDAGATHVATRGNVEYHLRTYEELRAIHAEFSMDVGTTWHPFEKPVS